MPTPPNFTSASARAHNGNVRVDMVAPPSGWNNGFVYSLSPDVARRLAAELLVAASSLESQCDAHESNVSATAEMATEHGENAGLSGAGSTARTPREQPLRDAERDNVSARTDTIDAAAQTERRGE